MQVQCEKPNGGPWVNSGVDHNSSIDYTFCALLYYERVLDKSVDPAKNDPNFQDTLKYYSHNAFHYCAVRWPNIDIISFARVREIDLTNAKSPYLPM